MLGDAPNRIITKNRELKVALSLFIVYLVLDVNLNTIFSDLPYHSVYLGDSMFKTLDCTKHDMFHRHISFINHAAIDSDLASESHTICDITCAAYMSEWENLNEEQYKD